MLAVASIASICTAAWSARARLTERADQGCAAKPSAANGSGRIWRITRGADGKGHGEVITFGDEPMGVTNGIELSPDEKTLYVGESTIGSTPARLLAYRLQDGKFVERRLLKTFDRFDLDGMRTDIDVKLFAARTDAGTVAVFSPDGNPLRENPVAERGADQSRLRGPRRKNRIRYPERR
jgi:sugar lactone lactonase YvrE